MADEEKATPEQKPAETVTVPPKSKSSNKTLFIVLGVLLFVFIILPGIIFGVAVMWLGRGDNAKNLTESLVEKSTGADIDTANGSVSVKNKEGDEISFGGEQDYADDFPSEVPKHPGGTVKSNVRSKSDNRTYWSNTVETSDSPDKVLAFFDDKLSSWENKGNYSINDSTTTNYEKGDLELTITVSKDSSSGKTNISYMVVQQDSSTSTD